MFVNVQWRKAEPHVVWRSKITDDATFGHCLNDAVAFFKAKGHLAAPFLGIARAVEGQARASGFDFPDK